MMRHPSIALTMMVAVLIGKRSRRDWLRYYGTLRVQGLTDD
jgi:hypothetical protein